MDQFRQSGCGTRRSNPSCSPKGNGNGNRNQAWNECLANLPLAMAYVPGQSWNTIYEAEKALCRGTAFPELDLPFGC